MAPVPLQEGAGATAAAEAQADAAVAIAEAQADAQVEIAQIDANRSVAVAEIDAEQDAEDIAWLRGELDSLRARCATQEDALLRQETQLTTLAAQMAELTGMMTTLAAAQPILPLPSEPEPIQEPETLPVERADGRKAANADDLPADERARGTQRIRRHWL